MKTQQKQKRKKGHRGRSSAPYPERRVPEINVIGNRMIVRYGDRDRRRHEAIYFRQNYDVVSTALKNHILAGDTIDNCLETSIKIPWVGVHGIDSICVVARSKDLLRLERNLKMKHSDIIYKNTTRFIIDIWNTMISEVEDVTAKLGESCQMFNQSNDPYIVGPPIPCQMLHKCSKSPFGVVSVIEQDKDKKVHNGSRAKYDVEGAIKFLQEGMGRFSDFTFNTTTQAAISAFQHLCRREFLAHEIRAFVLKNNEPHGRELKQSRKDCDVEEFIDIINVRPRQPSFF